MALFTEYQYDRISNADDATGALYTLSSPRTIMMAGVGHGLSDSVGIGFAFSFDGVSYRNFECSPHGWMRLSGDDSFTETSPADLYTQHDNVLLAPWMQAQKTASGIKTDLLGSPGSYIRVIEWNTYGSLAQTSTDHDQITYQVAIHQSPNKIEFRYGTTITTTGTPDRTAYNAAVGVKVDTTSGTANKNVDFYSTILSASKTNLKLIGYEFKDWPGLEVNTGGMPAGKTQYFFRFASEPGRGAPVVLVNDDPSGYTATRIVLVCDERF